MNLDRKALPDNRLHCQNDGEGVMQRIDRRKEAKMASESLLTLCLLLVSLAPGVVRSQEIPDPNHPSYEVGRVSPDGPSATQSKNEDGKKELPPEKFDAPKAQLFRLILSSVLGDPASWGLGKTVSVILLASILLFWLPIFLAADYARGSGRNVWMWSLLALFTSWLVLPITWLTPNKSTE